jgi:predicted small lipoprotein YifL
VCSCGALIAFLAACGQRGPLFLPDRAATPVAAGNAVTASSPSAAAGSAPALSR